MDQFFLCAACGEENELFIDPTKGDKQEFVQDCRVCCRPNVVKARFNYYSNEYDLEVYQEDVG
ncbi:MAG: CPXCG motif-containing cysteine-rich protein [Candidatus Zixiibacteriota bacterium]